MPIEAVYTASATATGDGRNGHVRSVDGVLDFDLAIPKEMGGPGGALTNPEQLFAAGYSACLHSAVKMIAKGNGIDVTDSAIRVEIGLVKGDTGFSLQATITGEIPGVDRNVAADLLAQAHQRCPYSKAIRGNVDATLTVA